MIAKELVAGVLGAALATFAAAQCSQGWMDDGGLRATSETGTITAAAMLNAGSHEYVFACGNFDFIRGRGVSGFGAFDNGLVTSPFALPGWEGVSGSAVNMKEFEGKVYFAGSFVVNGQAAPLVSWDGATLEPFATITGTSGKLVAIGSSGGSCVIHLVCANGSIVRWNGSNWANMPTLADVRAVEFLDDVPSGRLIAQTGTARLRFFDGAAWQLLPNSEFDAALRTIRAEGHEVEATLYAGGDFGTISGLTVKRIAYFRGGAWSSLGAGIATPVFAIGRTGASGASELVIATHRSFPTSALAMNAYVFRGGGWTPILTAPQTSAAAILAPAGLAGTASGLVMLSDYRIEISPGVRAPLARWNGTTWSALAGSLGTSSGDVGAIEKLDLGNGPAIYAAGNFQVIGGGPSSIAKLGLSGWESVGNGLGHVEETFRGNGVTAIGIGRTASGQRLLAGGYDPNSSTHLFLKMFDGTSWTNFSTGMAGYNVNQFFDFDPGDGVHTYAIVKFGNPTALFRLDGNQWTPISPSFTGIPFAAMVFNNGDGDRVYLARAEASAGARQLLRWSGAAIENFDDGLPRAVSQSIPNGVHCLLARETGESRELLAAGDFRPNTGNPGATFLARLSGSHWEQFLPIPPGPIAEMAMHNFGNGPVLAALVYEGGTQLYTNSTGLRPYRLVNGQWESFGDIVTWVNHMYAHNTAVGVLKEIDGTLYLGGPIRSVDGKISNLIARFGPRQCFCAADINQDGAGDFFDYLDFVNAFAAGDAAADFNRDGAIDLFDYLDFVDALAAGC